MRINTHNTSGLPDAFSIPSKRRDSLSGSAKQIFFALTLLLVSGSIIIGFCGSPHAVQTGITVNYPPDKTVMELGLLSISLSIPEGSADLIKASVNDNERINIVPAGEYVCFTVRLSAGINKIDITAMKNKKPADSISLNVFQRSDIISMYKTPPPDFQKDSFHMKEWSRCAACHTLEPRESDKNPINIAAFSTETTKNVKEAATAASTCYSCHKAITSYPFVHGPASVWSCLSCHDAQAKPRYLVKKPDADECFVCHTEQKADWGGKKFIHGPVNIGNCAICHNPHAAENPFNLVQPSWDLCISCHAGKETGRHIIAGYVYGDSHPTRGKPDPLRPGKEMVCTSCHNPHASDYSRLWALNAQSAFVLCQKCHQK